MNHGEEKHGSKLSFVFCLGTALAMFGASLAAQPTANSDGWATGEVANGGADAAPLAELNPNGLALAAPARSEKAGNARMRVRVKGPNGRTWKATVPAGETYYWAPQGPDGQYRFEAMMVTPRGTTSGKGQAGSRREAKQAKPSASKIYGTFEVRNGTIIRPSEPSEGQRSQQQLSLLETLIGPALKAVTPAAKAQDVFADSTTPDFVFDDSEDEDCTPTSDWEWSGEGGTSDSDTNNFVKLEAVPEDLGSGCPGGFITILEFNHTGEPSGTAASSENSMIVSGNGDINFANGDVSIDRSLNNVGIGTTTPDTFPELHVINTATSNFAADIKLEESGSGNIGWITNDGTNLKLEGTNTNQDIFNVDLTAPEDSINVDDLGDIGIGVANPCCDLHIASGSLGAQARFEDTDTDGSTWDVGAENAGFFIEQQSVADVFTSSENAVSDSMRVASGGDVGLGTDSPQRPLHIQRSDGTSEIRVQEVSSTVDTRTLFELRNTGGVRFDFTDSSSGRSWDFSLRPNGFNINNKNVIGAEVLVRDNGEFRVGPGGSENFVVEPDGDVFVTGSLVHSSSRSSKRSITPVNLSVVLNKLKKLRIAEWSYKEDQDNDRHLSPMAEDFHAIFGLGPDRQHVSPSDLAGVALAATKALEKENEELKKESAAKDKRIESLEARIERLEQKMLEPR